MKVTCRCGTEFDLAKAPWCNHEGTKTKMCPNGHCICHKLKNKKQWRPATGNEKKQGFGMMLREEYGGVREKLPKIKLYEDDRFKIPKKFRNMKRLVIKEKYSTEMLQGRSVRWWSATHKDIPKDCVEFNGERYRFVKVKGKLKKETEKK
jgi:hypothetical protein